MILGAISLVIWFVVAFALAVGCLVLLALRPWRYFRQDETDAQDENDADAPTRRSRSR